MRGVVIDRESEFPLIGATVQLLSVEPLMGASTNTNGEFILNEVPIGRHNIKVSYLGYDDLILPNVLVGSAKEVILNVALQEAFLQLDEVVISASNPKERANNEMTTVSARSFSTDETSRFAASVDDPARMAQSFAGVSTTDDLSNEIVIRGNSPLGLLWRLNGIEIPSPNHFSAQGASNGGISALSVNMLDNSDFLTGAFPAEYGNATSGVFDVKLRNGNNQKRETAFQLGVLGTDIAFEGPFKKGYQGSYLVNYRYSTLSLLTAAGIIDTGDEDNIFQDLAFQLNLPTEKFGIFKLFGLAGLSSAIGDANRDSVRANPTEEYEDSEFISNFGILGLSHKYFLNEQSYLETALSLNRQSIGYIEDAINPNDFSLRRIYEDQYVNDAYRFSTTYNHKFNGRNTIRNGIIWSHLTYDFFGDGEDDNDINRVFLNEKGKANTLQLFSQWKYRITQKWTMNSGVHFFRFDLANQYSLEPRLGFSYALNEVNRFSFGYGLHSRLAPISVYNANTVDDFGAPTGKTNQDLDLTKAHHFVVGYDRQLSEQVHLKIEAYYQSLFDVLVFDDPNSSFSAINSSDGYTSRTLSDDGTAENIGLEFTLEKFLSKRFYYLFTASVFDANYSMPDGRTFDSRFDQGFNLSLLGGKEFSVGKEKQNLLGINLRWIIAGGNRYRPIDFQSSNFAQETIRINDVGFSERTPGYYRFDVTLNYRINKAQLAHIISLQVQNVSNRINIFDYYFDDEEDRILPVDQFGLIPVLKYRIEF